MRAVVNVCPVSSAKRATQKVEFRAIEEEKQEEVVVVEVPEPKPADQIREKPGIAVVVATTLLQRLSSPVHACSCEVSPNLAAFFLIFLLQEEFRSQRTDSPALGDLFAFRLAPHWPVVLVGSSSGCGGVGSCLLRLCGCSCKCGLGKGKAWS